VIKNTDLASLICIGVMKYLLSFLFLVPLRVFSQDHNCNYVLKSGLDQLAVYDLDRQAALLYDTVTVPAKNPFIIEKSWVLLPERTTDTSIIAFMDYELNPDTVLRAELEIPLNRLVCIENMDTAVKEQFVLSVMEDMYRRFYRENEQPVNKTLQDYSPDTRSFFYHSFYWAEGYLGRDIIYSKEDPLLWSHYLYVLSNDVWGDSDEGSKRIALLFAARSVLFVQAFRLIGREQNRSYIITAIRNYFGQYLHEPALRFDHSAANRLFSEDAAKDPEARVALLLQFYEPYLQQLGFTKNDVQAFLK